jgi:hypothetical protein
MVEAKYENGRNSLFFRMVNSSNSLNRKGISLAGKNKATAVFPGRTKVPANAL